MARDISPEEARDEKVYELTAIHHEKLRRQLQGGNPEVASAIDEAISHEMDRAFWLQVVRTAGSATGDGLNGERIRKLVEKALAAQAEVDATREVEQLEQAAKNDPDNCQPQTHAMARRLDEINSRF